MEVIVIPSSFNNYSELLDLFISREKKFCPKIREDDIIIRKIGISIKMYDRLKRGYIPEFNSKTSTILRRYFETFYNRTFVHYKGTILTRELPQVPKTMKERRLEKRISNLITHVKLLEIENNFLRNRLKENN